VQISVGNASNRLDADRGSSLMSGASEDADGLALTSEAEDTVDSVPKYEHRD
jgi:hypothetical protein